MPACDTVFQTGKLDPHYPKVCGHRGNVLDIKWNPFNDFEIASCSEDATVSAHMSGAEGCREEGGRQAPKAAIRGQYRLCLHNTRLRRCHRKEVRAGGDMVGV